MVPRLGVWQGSTPVPTRPSSICWSKKQRAVSVYDSNLWRDERAVSKERSMPYKPQHPCGYPGCPRLTHRRYCSEHERQAARQYDKYERNPDTWKRYNGQWRKIRAAYIAEHPLCEMCEKEGRLTPAREVHHRLAIGKGGGNEWKNLQAVCHSCHSRLTLEATMHGHG